MLPLLLLSEPRLVATAVAFSVRPDDLAAHVIRAVVDQSGIDPTSIDDVYFGAANQSGEDNRNVARMASLLAGLPESVPGVTVNRLCASGLEAINIAARMIESGQGEIYLAGGVESMSRAPYVVSKSNAAFGRSQEMYDTSIGWRFVHPKMEEMGHTDPLGITAETVARSTTSVERPKTGLRCKANNDGPRPRIVVCLQMSWSRSRYRSAKGTRSW